MCAIHPTVVTTNGIRISASKADIRNNSLTIINNKLLNVIAVDVSPVLKNYLSSQSTTFIISNLGVNCPLNRYRVLIWSYTEQDNQTYIGRCGKNKLVSRND